jgi:tetratricopeptide (TPR) repeat protein
MKKPANLAQQLDHMLRQAVALQQNGAFAEAQELYREILELKPRHFDALQLLGALALQGGRIEEGVDLLSKALAVNSKQAAIHSNLAYALNALHRFDEALASANRALALQPQFPDALNNRGNAQAGLDQPLDALASFDRAIALAADFAQAWNNRACVLRDLGRPADALASCDRALALQPGYAEAWSNRGNALSDMNEPHEAERRSIRAAMRRRLPVISVRSRSIPRPPRPIGTKHCVCCKWGSSKRAGGSTNGAGSAAASRRAGAS